MENRLIGLLLFVLFSLILCTSSLSAQTILTADGQTAAYTLINNAFGGTAEETPDCSHPSFGPHITQSFDTTLNKPVFNFNIHVTPDNDRCINFDRQRLETKTNSPSSIIAFQGDSMDSRWLFKLDSGFQPSPDFTHIHQIKAIDGNNGAPLITLSPRSGSPNILQILHFDDSGVESVLSSTNLSPFLGTWVEAHENVTFNFTGSYSITLTRVSDGATLFTYSNRSLQLWRTGTTEMRGKWGIYRSLNASSFLRDEIVLYGGFCVAKEPATCPNFISPQNFLVKAGQSSQTVTAGSSTSFTVTITPSGGFSGTVSQSLSGLPSGATGTFNPASISGGSGSSTLNVSTVSTTPPGTYTVTITGTSGSLSNSTKVTLVVKPVQPQCVTGSAGNGWHNTALATAQTGTFTTQYDATPSASPLNAVVALSHGVQTAYTGFATLTRFNPSGDIDARNGGTFAAASTIPFSAGVTYHFRLVINVPAHSYSIFVTPAGETEITVGTNFAFRSEQSGVPALDEWGLNVNVSNPGSLTACNFTAQ